MSILTIPTRTELIGIGITIEAAKKLQLPPQYATALHAWFLDQVRQTNPELSQQLHNGQDEKPFTISGIPEIAHTNQIQAHQTYQWQITALNGPFCNQGGDRATNSANLWANIIAHQEVGDSLTSIAADLKMFYGTVKKYVQLAKKQLAQM